MESDSPSKYKLALSEHRNKNLQSAIELLNSVIEETPTFEDAYESLAVIFYNEKRYDDSMTVLQKWIRVNPNAIMAHTNLSRCYVAKGMIDEAEKEQAEARRLTWKEELKAKKIPIPAQVDPKGLIERYKKVIEFDPADVLGYFSLGSVYLEAGMKRDAMDTFEKAIQVAPEHSPSYLSLGQALEGLGDREKAKKIYEKGIQVADKKGDIMPLKKMEARLRQLQNSPPSS